MAKKKPTKKKGPPKKSLLKNLKGGKPRSPISAPANVARGRRRSGGGTIEPPDEVEEKEEE